MDQENPQLDSDPAGDRSRIAPDMKTDAGIGKRLVLKQKGFSSVKKTLREFRREGDFIDVFLEPEDLPVPVVAHKAILAAHSNVFKRLFKNPAGQIILN